MGRAGTGRKILRAAGAVLLLSLGFVLVQRQVIVGQKARQWAVSAADGIESLEFVEIGGIRQAVLIRGNSVDNPVLLDLHGGPGYPNMATGSYKPEWEEHYTVVYFDQRLAGKTYFANDVAAVKATDSMDRRVDDVIEMAQYLADRFGQERIVLHGTSWGTVLGLRAVGQCPQLFGAYIGNSQVVNQFAADTLVYDAALREAARRGDKGNVDKLAALGDAFPTRTYSRDYYDSLSAVRTVAQQYAGEMPLAMGGVAESAWPQLYSPYYTVREATYFLRYTNLVSDAAPRYMVEEYDMRALGLRYEVPLFFVSGRLDIATPVVLLEEVFGELEAPQKQLVVYEDAGHGVGYRRYTDLMLDTVLSAAAEGAGVP